MRAQHWPNLQAIVRSQWGLPLFVAALAAGALAPQYCLAQTGGATVAKWAPTGDLNVARSEHSATLLRDGRVLVAGGYGNGYLDSAELYDPATGTWRMTGKLNEVRSGHVATLLADGRVLVVAGCIGLMATDCSTTEIFNPTTEIWSPTGRLRVGPGLPSTGRLQTGEVLLVGSAWMDRQTDLYDPLKGTWTYLGSIPGSHTGFVATLLANGQLLAAGGGNDQSPVSTALIFDPAARAWNRTGDLSIARIGHTMTMLNSGSVLAAGGRSSYAPISSVALTAPTDLFDAMSGTWTSVGSLHVSRIEHSATLLANGEVLIAGGKGQSDALSDAEVFEPVDRTWRYTASLNTARSMHSATRLADGRVLVTGGYVRDYDAMRSSELYEHGVSFARIDSGFTGSWYNPAQNGHGLMLEVLPGAPMRLLVGWFTFAPQGGQSWITGVGQIDGNQASVQAYQMVGSGGRFPPNFDAANVRQESWGTLTFTFVDCTHAHVEWASIAPGYGIGGMDLTRLTLPAGLTCGVSGLGP